MSVDGGAPVPLGEAGQPWGVSWGADDTIMFGQGAEGIWGVPGAGGTPRLLLSVEEGERAYGPQLLPGGEWVLFTLQPSSTVDWDQAQIVAQSLVTGERRVLLEGGRDARFVPTGHLVYAQRGTLLAVLFDADSLTVTPGAVSLVEDVPDAGARTGAAQFGLSNTGALVYALGAGVYQFGSVLGWVDRDGQMTPLWEKSGEFGQPRLAPNDGRVVLQVRTDEDARGELRDLWLYDIESSTPSRFTAEGFNDFGAWMPGGTTLSFASNRSGAWDLYSKAADGSDDPRRLLETSPFESFGGSWSPDGTLVFYESIERDLGGAEVASGRDIWTLKPDGQASEFLTTEFNERAPDLSPDGRWIAYVSDRSGADAVYVRPFPEGGREVRISTERGTGPVWSRGGEDLFYRDATRMMVAAWDADQGMTPGRPTLVFDGPYVMDPPNGSPNYDVANDGRFLMIRREDRASSQINVVLNWTQELLERVPIP